MCALVIADLLCLSGTRAAGGLVGLAAAIKLTPLIFILYLWLAGRRRATTVAIATFVACAIVAWTIVPRASVEFWSSVVFEGGTVHAFTSSGNISLDALLQRLGVHGQIHTMLWIPICLAVVVVALRRAIQAGHAGDDLGAMVIVGAASLVVSPISWTHHQIWLVLAAFVVLRSPEQRLPGRWTLVAQAAWTGATLSIMVLSAAELRPFLAIAVATLIPIRRTVRDGAPPHGALRHLSELRGALKPSALLPARLGRGNRGK
ncbi:hypothetical protein GCM10022254_48370 [Actinomadura meridiana]|uniref:DUF2029 domain-containing protein n=1 Tax=Actinomadura meridiana TaxID=559626 RepID=A0ABP8CBI5_9ACTN